MRSTLSHCLLESDPAGNDANGIGVERGIVVTWITCGFFTPAYVVLNGEFPVELCCQAENYGVVGSQCASSVWTVELVHELDGVERRR